MFMKFVVRGEFADTQTKILVGWFSHQWVLTLPKLPFPVGSLYRCKFNVALPWKIAYDWLGETFSENVFLKTNWGHQRENICDILHSYSASPCKIWVRYGRSSSYKIIDTVFISHCSYHHRSTSATNLFLCHLGTGSCMPKTTVTAA